MNLQLSQNFKISISAFSPFKKFNIPSAKLLNYANNNQVKSGRVNIDTRGEFIGL